MVQSLLAVTIALAQMGPPPQQVLSRRPPVELSSWVGLGGGVITAERTRGLFDLRLGGDLTLAPCKAGTDGCTGDTRFGPFVEAESATFKSATAVGGLVLFLGGMPKNLRLFFYDGEGTLLVRLGAGYTWRHHLPGDDRAPIASFTVAYGYRCPFSLREPGSEYVDVQAPRPSSRYMIGVRLWLNAQADLAGPRTWQVTGGLEFEPVGALRYLTGIGY